MSPARPVLLTLAASGTVVASVVGTAWEQTQGASDDAVPPFAVVLATAVPVLAAWLILRHDSTTPTAPALAWAGGCIAACFVVEALSRSHLPGAGVALKGAVGLWPLNVAGVLALMLVFPHGRLPGRLWSWLPAAFAASTTCLLVSLWGAHEVDGRIVDMPTGQLRSVLGAVGQMGVGVCLLLGVAALVIRYRAGSAKVRSQIRWLMLAGAGVVVALFAGWTAQALGASNEVAFAPFLVAIVTLVPGAVVLAVVHHDLFDVDRLLSDTVSWFVTLVVSAAVYAGVVVATGDLLHRHAAVSSAAAAFVAALALLPAHRLVRRSVGQVFDRDRYVAVSHVARFAADVRAGRRVPEDVEEVLRSAQGDPGLRLLLAEGDGWVGLDGQPDGSEGGYTIESGGDPVARILLTHESARARRRIGALARAAWVPIEVSRLRLGLRASRGRIAEATVAEQRRLERDLHDGAQQRLVATGMRLRSLQRRLEGEAAAEIDAAVAELEGTIAELRRLAQGVRPSRLEDGLEAALATVRTSSPIPLTLDVEEPSGLSETTVLHAYLVVSEAVANVLKHARATHIGVRVRSTDAGLAVEVCDDGIGGVPAAGALTALRDRIESVGGDLSYDSPPGVGTTVRAVL